MHKQIKIMTKKIKSYIIYINIYTNAYTYIMVIPVPISLVKEFFTSLKFGEPDL